MQTIALWVLWGACTVVTLHAVATGLRRLSPHLHASQPATIGLGGAHPAAAPAWSDDRCCRVLLGTGLAWLAGHSSQNPGLPEPLVLAEGSLIACVVTLAAMVLASWVTAGSNRSLGLTTALGMTLAAVVGVGLS